MNATLFRLYDDAEIITETNFGNPVATRTEVHATTTPQLAAGRADRWLEV